LHFVGGCINSDKGRFDFPALTIIRTQSWSWQLIGLNDRKDLLPILRCTWILRLARVERLSVCALKSWMLVKQSRRKKEAAGERRPQKMARQSRRYKEPLTISWVAPFALARFWLALLPCRESER